MPTKDMTLLDVRYWLESAVKAKGASVGTVSCEATVANIVIELEGREYSVSIRPRHEDDFDDCA
jgi:hypothetical protein